MEGNTSFTFDGQKRTVSWFTLNVVLDDRYSPPLNTAGEQAKLLPRED